MTVSEECLEKIRAALTYEWQSTVDISRMSMVLSGNTRLGLMELRKRGEVEKIWDGLIGKAYWRLPCGERFHKASVEVNPCRT